MLRTNETFCRAPRMVDSTFEVLVDSSERSLTLEVQRKTSLANLTQQTEQGIFVSKQDLKLFIDSFMILSAPAPASQAIRVPVKGKVRSPRIHRTRPCVVSRHQEVCESSHQVAYFEIYGNRFVRSARSRVGVRSCCEHPSA